MPLPKDQFSFAVFHQIDKHIFAADTGLFVKQISHALE
jgi:hypothetical protein